MTKAVFAIALFSLTHFAYAKPPAFRIQKNGVVSYLFGSLEQGVHLSELSPQVLENLRKADVVALPEAFSESQLESLRTNSAQFFSDQVLPELPKSSAPFLDEITKIRMENLGVPSQVAAAFHDDDCSVMSLPFLHNYFENRLLNADLMRMAYQDQKEIVNLGRPGLRAEALDVQTAALGPKASCSLQTILASYKNEELRDMEDVVIDRYKHGSILNASNQSSFASDYLTGVWAEKLIPLLEQKKTFVALGLVHIFGPKGIVAQLKSAGFEVDEIPQQADVAENIP